MQNVFEKLPVKTKNYLFLFEKITNLLEKGRKKVYTQINSVLTYTYWQIGREIVEFEQGGKKRAEYGEEVIKRLSKDLTKHLGKGFSYRNLQQIKKFYLLFSKKQTVSAESFGLSWSHYVRLLSIDNCEERSFYEIESKKNNWSVRELSRQFDTSLYERLALSKDKKGIKELAQKGQIVTKTEDALKEPYVLEFLGFGESYKYSESDLETAIIDNLQNFLLELGKGFTFVARQKRITSGAKHFYIDLVFYNRLLKCFVLVDLKIGELKHQDIGQMQMYVNYYDREIKEESENTTIGIILCKEKDDFVIDFTLPKDNKKIFAKKYQLYLPSKNELKKELKKIAFKRKNNRF